MMLEIRDLVKTYRLGFLHRKQPSLRGISLSVPDGAVYGFIGPNGAGKTTTMKSVMGLLRPTSGSILLMGRHPLDPRARQEIGYMPEQPYFYDYLTGRELLTYYGHLVGLSGRELAARIEASCARIKVQDSWLDRRLRTYSKGMCQRLGLAQALLGRPRFLILDEPMSGLDPIGRRDIRQAIRDLHAEGTTIFYSSHVLSDVEDVCTHAAMIVDGTIRRDGPVAELLNETSDEGKRLNLEDILAQEMRLV